MLETVEEKTYVKQLWKHPIYTAFEVKLLLDFLDEGTAQHLSVGYMAIEMMRPQEVVDLIWPWFSIDSDKIIEYRHMVYKPSNRKVKSGMHTIYKEVKKPIFSRSKWLSNQTIAYAKITPKYERSKLFPWTTTDMMQTIFTDIRKKIKNGKLSPEYVRFLDKTGYQIKGRTDAFTQFRLNLYSLRRFSITFHYWVTFKQDIIALSKHIGHTNPKTTYEHYVFPKESIGLTQTMIDQNISIDEFIHLRGKKQSILTDYTEESKKPFIPAGQTRLSSF